MSRRLDEDLGGGDGPREPRGKGPRVLPSNIDAEQALLGALIAQPEILVRLPDNLRPEHFFETAHQRIFAQMQKAFEIGEMCDLVTLSRAFRNDEAFKNVGGAAQYLAGLYGARVTISGAPDYAELVLDAALRRALCDFAEDVETAAQDISAGRAQELLDSAFQSLSIMAEDSVTRGGDVPLSDAMMAAYQTIEDRAKGKIKPAISTGLIDLDRLLGGLYPGDLVVIAARPAMGKTALLLSILMAAAQEAIPSQSFSLEMSAEQYAQRFLACHTGIPTDRQRRADIREDELRELADAALAMQQLPVTIDQRGGLSLPQVRIGSQRFRRRIGRERRCLIGIDYLQLMNDGTRRRETNRNVEIGNITSGLKAVAMDLGVPVILLSQLSRAVEQREDKRPRLSDLRESGAIEQDADQVVFLYREAYYLEQAEPRGEPKDGPKYEEWNRKLSKVEGTAEMIVAKNRHGRTGTALAQFDGERSQFRNLVKQESLGDNW